ncbi:hypothetical protein [Bradyrhizobium genosp. P]|uniref:hypothetical protein n=1 Tax=Bradyrhizobium genosp. P TaxID=83641 RepID=UPI003CF88293
MKTKAAVLFSRRSPDGDQFRRNRAGQVATSQNLLVVRMRLLPDPAHAGGTLQRFRSISGVDFE